MPVATQSGEATVITLKSKRRAARSGKRRTMLARALVALWSGLAMLTSVLVVAALGALVLKNGFIGLGIALGIASIAGWAIAGRLLRPRPESTQPGDLRVIRRTSR